jgi:hypothetical protein
MSGEEGDTRMLGFYNFHQTNYVYFTLIVEFVESVAEWSMSRTHNSDVVGSRPGATEIF